MMDPNYLNLLTKCTFYFWVEVVFLGTIVFTCSDLACLRETGKDMALD